MGKRGAIIAAVAGLALGTAAVVWLGAGQIWNAVAHVGWLGLLCLVLWQLGVFVVLGFNWSILCPNTSPWLLFWGRLVREGGMTCLPLSVVGGFAFSTRALMLCGVTLARAAASGIVDLVTEGIGIIPFLLAGLVIYAARRPSTVHISLPPIVAGIVLLILGSFAVLRFRRLFGRLLHRSADWLLKHRVEAGHEHAAELGRELEHLLGQHARIAWASLLHVVCWCAAAGHVWIGYHLLGAHPTLAQSLAMESVFSVVLSAGQLVPGSFGVQEVAYVGVGALFGMPAHLSLALSLLRRARDLVIGAPALLSWQMLELRRLRRG